MGAGQHGFEDHGRLRADEKIAGEMALRALVGVVGERRAGRPSDFQGDVIGRELAHIEHAAIQD